MVTPMFRTVCPLKLPYAIADYASHCTQSACARTYPAMAMTETELKVQQNARMS